MEKLDAFKKSLIPKYYQIYEDIYTDIRDGLYQEGDKIPAENELLEKYKVSRGTVREAIKMLLHQGAVSRERGRGTFVTYKKIEQDVKRLMGFTELMQLHGKKATARILKIETKLPSKRIQSLLKIGKDDKVTKIQRLRFGDQIPLIIERSYFVYDVFKPFLKYDLENESIYTLMYEESDLRLGNAQQSIEAIISGPEQSRHLKIEHGSPLLLIKRLITTSDNKPFQYSEDIYRSDKLKFTIQTLMYDESHENFTLPIGLAVNDTADPERIK